MDRVRGVLAGDAAPGRRRVAGRRARPRRCSTRTCSPVWRRYSAAPDAAVPVRRREPGRVRRRSGLPMMRHMVLAAPDEPVAGIGGQDQYLFGADILVAPVAVAGGDAGPCFLPAGEWIEWWPSVAMSERGRPSGSAGRRELEGGAARVGAPVGEIPLVRTVGSRDPDVAGRRRDARGLRRRAGCEAQRSGRRGADVARVSGRRLVRPPRPRRRR